MSPVVNLDLQTPGGFNIFAIGLGHLPEQKYLDLSAQCFCHGILPGINYQKYSQKEHSL